MSIAAELERAVGGLAALCRRSFGTCGEETLLFRPPDAPVVTGEGHAVLVAWKRGSDAHDPLTTFLLTAADGVHKQLGDASSEFILMIEAAVIHAAQGLRREQDARSDVDRARLSRAFSGLKWELQREIQKIGGLQLAVPVEVNCETMQPSKQFRETSSSILKSALRGVLGERAVDFVVDHLPDRLSLMLSSKSLAF
ncbi:hypothetical protein PF005_g21407 [Phytophthora fragariae]|uniref:Uncharacterized protein n=1 Tax=Phytophthora fragariae TaxID=53985 RepID=A0A6A3E4E2_9STRA|nr:hypothetical protein PF009_g22431 [Phytophthora fragariae]KAE9109826.1 hypothetical protein PF006_g20585 [Phytophthora fragariae]KAE9185059.1 hypothetical protein PF005_g21407 [Phytophthora fragariae]KAE9195599.1 hypothetical protein PF004_g20384 [Phytophthora fragariae]KAE9276633.1 hypothetical protein PF001_g26030 [Phytophthora fragariae]